MFILQNQDGYFLSKSGDWLDGREPSALFRTELKDEAVNQLFETNSQDYSLRITILECESSSKKHPIIPVEQLPPPLSNSSDEIISDIEMSPVNNEGQADCFPTSNANNG